MANIVWPNSNIILKRIITGIKYISRSLNVCCYQCNNDVRILGILGIFKDCIIKSAFLQFTSVKIIENCRDDRYYCIEHTLKQSMGIVGTHFSLQKRFK